MASVSPLDTPLLRQIKRFSYAITGLIAVLAVLLFAYGRWGCSSLAYQATSSAMYPCLIPVLSTSARGDDAKTAPRCWGSPRA